MTQRSRLLSPSRHLASLEHSLARRVPLSPNTISWFKLLVVAPLFAAGTLLDWAFWWLVVLLGCFFVLDYLDGAVAKATDRQTRFGRILDRSSDYPVLATVLYAANSVVPRELLVAKLAVDGLLLLQFVRGRCTENRVRTLIHYTALLAAFACHAGWLPRLFTPSLVAALFVATVGFSALVALYNFGCLRRRFIADALSGLNLLSGLSSIVMASVGHYEFSLACLLLGALFDGFDGAAARRWGGTRIGVYADDVADGVNYGLAPGAAVYFALGGTIGGLLGALYASFTITRLVYFTLAKNQSDPTRFSGAPSTVGGIVVLSSLVLFADDPALVGTLVGAASILMVSFGNSYRHLGRFVAAHPKVVRLLPVGIVLLLGGYPVVGVAWPAAVLLATCLGYGLMPMVSAFARVTRVTRVARPAGPATAD